MKEKYSFLDPACDSENAFAFRVALRDKPTPNELNQMLCDFYSQRCIKPSYLFLSEADLAYFSADIRALVTDGRSFHRYGRFFAESDKMEDLCMANTSDYVKRFESMEGIARLIPLPGLDDGVVILGFYNGYGRSITER
jgi:hypothetical protein